MGGLVGDVAEVGIGEDDDWEFLEPLLGANFSEDFQSIHLREHQIQQQGVKMGFVQTIESHLAVGSDFGLVTFLFKFAAIDISDDGIVFDDE